MTVAPERGSAVALEIQAGGIEDRQPDIIEEMRRLANSCSSIRSLLVRGARPLPRWSASSSPSQAIARYR